MEDERWGGIKLLIALVVMGIFVYGLVWHLDRRARCHSNGGELIFVLGPCMGGNDLAG